MLALGGHAHTKSGPPAPAPSPPAAIHKPHLSPEDVAEYEKILNIRDQIFAGTHPRLKIPESVVRKPAPRSVAQTSPPSTSASVYTPVSQAPASEPSVSAPLLVHSLTSATHAGQGTAIPALWAVSTSAASHRSADSPGTGVSTPKPASEIDPILLTKSDDLIRAETQLQRQRIERALRDHAESKRIEERQKPPIQELKPDFDVSDVLNKALEIVKPLPPPSDQANNVDIVDDGDRVSANAASDSFDEHSYYSSRAPDSPQNEDEDLEMTTAPRLVGKVDTDESDDTVVVNPARVEHDSVAGSNGMVDQLANHHNAKRSLGHAQPWTEDTGHQYSPPEQYEEPEYSPPGPNISLNGRGDALEASFPGQSSRKEPPTAQPPKRQSPQPKNPKVVRNHITSPAAPQPSRVSPLAIARVSSITQSRQGRRSRQTLRPTADQDLSRNSPEAAPVQPVMSRKRRRIQQAQDKKRLAELRKATESPDTPYIKPEPVSPPPFVSAPPAEAHYTRSRLIQEIPADVQYVPQPSQPENRVLAGRVHELEDRRVRNYELDSPIELHTPRTTSRMGFRRPVRDEQDLRRVASLQHARHAEYIQEFPEPVSGIVPRHGRAVSYVEPSAPQVERPRYQEEGQPAQYVRRYMTRPLSPHYRESFAQVRVSDPHVMGPPAAQRRIVVDAEGNRYYESVDPSRALQTPSSRLTRLESYDGTGHQAASRSMSIVDDHYRDRRYIQEMPPPEVTYRRNLGLAHGPTPGHVTGYAVENELGDPRFYDRGPPEQVPMMRSASVQVVDYPSRQPQQSAHQRQLQPTYLEEASFPHEEIVRVASVRPPPSIAPRYEEHHDARPRMTSVRPVRRELSVYVDDEAGHAREYAPVERFGGGPSYITRPMARDERFFDTVASGRMEPEASSEVIRRASRRY